MQTQKHESALKILSIVIIFLAVIFAVVNFLEISTVKDQLPTGESTEAAITNGLVIVSMVAAVITMLLRVFIGLKGLAQLKGKGGNAHIIIAKILFVLGAISCVSILFRVFGGTQEFSSLFTPLTDVCLMGAFIAEANAVMKQRQYM